MCENFIVIEQTEISICCLKTVRRCYMSFTSVVRALASAPSFPYEATVTFCFMFCSGVYGVIPAFPFL